MNLLWGKYNFEKQGKYKAKTVCWEGRLGLTGVESAGAVAVVGNGYTPRAEGDTRTSIIRDGGRWGLVRLWGVGFEVQGSGFGVWGWGERKGPS